MRLLLVSVGVLFFVFGHHAANVVRIDENRVLSVNGKKLFPIGFSLPPPPTSMAPNGKPALAVLREAGATFLRTGGPEWDNATIDREGMWQREAAKHGMLCLPYIGHLMRGVSLQQTRSGELLKRIVSLYKDSNGLGAWKGYDEPWWGKVHASQLREGYDVLRKLDRDHPLLIIQAPRGDPEELSPYNGVSDIEGMDVYPVSYPMGTDVLVKNKNESVVGDLTALMASVIANATSNESSSAYPYKSLWMTLQIAWSGIIPPHTIRFPTFHQERFMAYQAIIHGARGLLFFGGHISKVLSERDKPFDWNWTFWDTVLQRLVQEIGTESPLHPALLAPNATLPISAVAEGYGSYPVEFIGRHVQSTLYILACWRYAPTVKVQFSVPGISNQNVAVLFESPRQVQLSANKYVDWFAPLDVHVYVIKLA